MKAKKLLNPRGYLSWTQVNMWLTNPERYIRQYMLREPFEIATRAIEFGKKFAEARETGEDEDFAGISSMVPQFSMKEYEIRETMHTNAGDVELLGRLDSFDPATLSFRDDKTGMTRWTQRKADEHKQLRHYATLIYLKYKKAPKEAWLDWIETEYSPDGRVRLTGHIQSFKVVITMGSILEYMQTAGRVAKEIDEEYRKQLQKLT